MWCLELDFLIGSRESSSSFLCSVIVIIALFVLSE
uniref:Uncharacterized protein n=1 Tax=Myoviridae sp. ctGrV43 TaxID=2825075 RepID=A0A8S5UEX1_9CAUD|nr:MAG TPA: hypothetical protein [Myoviridae sp. ctGrV43]